MSQTHTVLDDELVEISRENDDPQREIADEEFVINSSISQDREEAFRAAYVRDRAKAATAETLFQRANAFDSAEGWREDRAYGFNVLLHKGPFVEGSRWLSYGTWEFATVAERHVLRRLEEVFRPAIPADESYAVPRIASRIAQELERLSADLDASGSTPTMAALAGDLDSETLVDLFSYITPQWQSGPDADMPWIVGAFGGRPILQFPAVTDAAIYMADLQRLGRFVRYGSAPRLSVTEFDEARAADAIHRNPNIVKIPSGRPDTLDERIRQLRLRVNLKLYESNDIHVLEPSAVRGVRLGQAGTMTLDSIRSEVQRQQTIARQRGWDLRRLELGTGPFGLVKETQPNDRLQVDDVEWDIVEGSSRNGIHVIARDAQVIVHRL